MSTPILTVEIRVEQDIVLARQRARQIAGLLGFDVQDQTRMATAVSEIARNAFNYAGGGKVEFRVEGRTAPQVFLASISDQGPGIANLQSILDGQHKSPTGMGLGLAGARRLVDQFEIESAAGRGTTVWLKKILPKKAPMVTAARLARITDELVNQRPQTSLNEIQQQNQELLRTLEELRQRQEELVQLNRELEDTNRGVVALYAELDEKADHLRRADELKTRFLSNMSHEFCTPVNAILALCQILLDRTDGDLTDEQEKQITFIHKAAEDLFELVNDLLDLAKVEAGKIVVRPAEFEVSKLFGALRGMLRPLLVNESVSLIFEEPGDIPPLLTDEGKVSQILRNFISNALKFTERGQVRVSVRVAPGGDAVIFSVADTGIGIAPENQERIFQEFTQLENLLQRRVKGTGLGLPLSKKLAELLGGRISVTSRVGIGSTFSVTIPMIYREPIVTPEVAEAAWEADPFRTPVLVVEDAAEDRLIYEKFLKGSGFQLIPARTIREARQALKKVRPKAIVLDILLPGEDAWTFLAEVKEDDATREIPVLVVTTVEDEPKGLALGADAYCVKPVERSWLLKQLNRLTGQERGQKVLVIDNEEVFRYLLRQLLAGLRCTVLEAADGAEGLRRAREEQPEVIFLDLMMTRMSEYEVLDRLKADPATRDIPVVIITSKVLEVAEQNQLTMKALAILSKERILQAAAKDDIKQVLAKAAQGRAIEGITM
ncbi:MAG: response regulator [Acidobacteria bacterium]|nr:response regulator [Acidobacteriota bacterium]